MWIMLKIINIVFFIIFFVSHFIFVKFVLILCISLAILNNNYKFSLKIFINKKIIKNKITLFKNK